jgi:hypothetical protein
MVDITIWDLSFSLNYPKKKTVIHYKQNKIILTQSTQWSVLLVEETGIPGVKPPTCHKSLTNLITYLIIKHNFGWKKYINCITRSPELFLVGRWVVVGIFLSIISRIIKTESLWIFLLLTMIQSIFWTWFRWIPRG